MIQLCKSDYLGGSDRIDDHLDRWKSTFAEPFLATNPVYLPTLLQDWFCNSTIRPLWIKKQRTSFLLKKGDCTACHCAVYSYPRFYGGATWHMLITSLQVNAKQFASPFFAYGLLGYWLEVLPISMTVKIITSFSMGPLKQLTTIFFSLLCGVL